MGTAVKYRDFQVQTLSRNQLSYWQLCSSCDETQRAPPEDSWDRTRPLLPTARSSSEHCRSISLHQVGMFSKLWLGQPLTSPQPFSLLCVFLWNLCSGPVRDLGEKGQKDSSERAVSWPSTRSANISEHILLIVVLCGSGHMIGSSIYHFSHFCPLSEALKHPWEEHQGGVFLGGSTFYKRDAFKTLF